MCTYPRRRSPHNKDHPSVSIFANPAESSVIVGTELDAINRTEYDVFNSPGIDVINTIDTDVICTEPDVNVSGGNDTFVDNADDNHDDWYTRRILGILLMWRLGRYIGDFFPFSHFSVTEFSSNKKDRNRHGGHNVLCELQYSPLAPHWCGAWTHELLWTEILIIETRPYKTERWFLVLLYQPRKV